MGKTKIKLKVSQDFLDWWQKQICSNDQGLILIAWSAWNACEIKYKDVTNKKEVI